MRDLDDLKELKRELVALVRVHGEEVSDFKAFRQSLLEMNRRHRREAIGMYARALAKAEKRLAKRKGRKGSAAESRRRPTKR